MKSSRRMGRRVPSESLGIPAGLWLAVVLLLAATPAESLVINVPGDYTTIQEAIDSAAFADGDTVLVAEGTYYENIDFKGKRIVLSSHFLLDRNPQHIFNTVIDGSSPTHPDTASCVRLVNYEDSTTVLQGFTLTGGTGTAWTDPHGFGVFREGGGILCEYSSPVIQYNIIINNDAIEKTGLVSAGGGGIRAGDGAPRILNNIIMNNRGHYGAGIVLNFAPGVVRNNVIAFNTGGEDFGGSGVWKYGASDPAIVENNTIVGNVSVLGGGGVYNYQSSMTLRNNIIWGNEAPTFAQIKSNGAPFIAEYNCVEGGYSGTGNTADDPEFRGDYFYLSSASPAIDAGSPDAAYAEPEDPANPASARWPAMATTGCDIGAYGGPGGFSFEPVTILADTTLGFAPLDVQFESYSVYPSLSFEWDFGDGTSAAGSAVGHQFTAGGTYNVSVTVDTGDSLVTLMQAGLISVIADSLLPIDASGPANTKAVVPIYARNSLPLSQVIIPIEVFGNLAAELDSISTVGCRTDYFTIRQQIYNDPSQRRSALKLQTSIGGTLPDLEPGTGPILNLHFTIPEYYIIGAEDTVSVSGFLTYEPAFVSDQLIYAPSFNLGTVGVGCCENVGNVDGLIGSGGAVNISDLVYLVDFLFRSGPQPPCFEEADVEGSGSVNITDVTYMVDFLFRQGSPPASCP